MTLLDPDDLESRIAAVIVTYNSAKTLPDLLDSLEASTVGARVLIVDNGSSDETVRVARERKNVVVFDTGANLGYSGGINVARPHIRPTENVAILNPDLKIDVDALAHMLSVLESEPAVGIVAPQLRELDSGARFDSLRREPTVARALGDSIFGSRWRRRPTWFAETLRRDDEYASPRDVAWAGGAALLISSECNSRVGDWDAATYFLYSEETDYARRARDNGYRVRYEPRAVAHHVGSGSGQPAPLVALISVNRIRYFSRLHGRVRSTLFQLAVATQHALRVHDPRHRYALPVVLQKSRWADLPSGESSAPPSPEAVQPTPLSPDPKAT